jgi:hypothetical protein
MSIHDIQLKIANAAHSVATTFRRIGNAITLDALKGKARATKEAALIAEGVSQEAAALARAAAFRAAKSASDLAQYKPK